MKVSARDGNVVHVERPRVEHRSALTGGKDDWETPEYILDAVRAFEPIGLDPCTHEGNPVRAARFYTREADGLEAPWHNQGLVFVNPPYSMMAHWSRAIVRESERAEIIALVGARPGAKWYARMQLAALGHLEFSGRVRFVGAPSSAPFPSALLYFGERGKKFVAATRSLGEPFCKWRPRR